MNKEKKNADTRLYYKRRVLREPWWVNYRNAQSRCTNTKDNWHKRGIKCLITLQEIKFLWFRDKAYLMLTPSLDRIDNNGHYSLENCRFIEKRENSRIGNLGNKNKLGKYIKNPANKHTYYMREYRKRKRQGRTNG